MGKKRPFSLTGRNLEVLTALVRDYIGTGEPIASKGLAEKRKDRLSPASIRNVMAELEEHGYLAHPHTSAGRVPTEKAFRYYVQHLSARRLLPVDADFVRSNLSQAGTLDERLERLSRVLAALTGQLGIVVLAPLSDAVLQHVQFARLSAGRILVVLVTQAEVVRHRVVHLAEDLRPDELERISNYVNRNFAGWKLGEARLEILRRIEQERAAYDAILRRLRLLFLEGFLSADSGPHIYLDGASNLVEGAAGLGAERVRRLLQALEEKEKLVQLLDHCLRGEMSIAQKGSAGLWVRIGLEDASPVMKDFALIGAVCDLEGGLAGRIAVLGPTRMPYQRVMSAVAHAAAAFHHLSEPPE